MDSVCENDVLARMTLQSETSKTVNNSIMKMCKEANILRNLALDVQAAYARYEEAQNRYMVSRRERRLGKWGIA